MTVEEELSNVLKFLVDILKELNQIDLEYTDDI